MTFPQVPIKGIKEVRICYQAYLIAMYYPPDVRERRGPNLQLHPHWSCASLLTH